MMSVTPDTMRACLETVFVDNWGLLKYLRKTVHLKKDAIVTLDLVCKKCVVTGKCTKIDSSVRLHIYAKEINVFCDGQV